MSKNKYRLSFHLMPPRGWMNDPNGLCYYKGAYHVFFQYAPKDPVGTARYWGHYVSKDLINWDYVGIALKSDSPWDRCGAFSGSGLIEDGIMELFYTGNVEEEGDYDYVLSGRGANVITVKSEDGLTFSAKELLLSNKDYPDDYTCHVRDPKVWKSNDKYFMVLGGRKKGDKGAILQYESTDKLHWEFSGEVTTKDAFGYMWECPDAFTLDGKTVMMCCPQGVERNELRFQNIHQSGYFILEDRAKEYLEGFCNSDDFKPWDYGHDFYAPQTMVDDKGRTLLIGWAGMPDMEREYHNHPIIEEGWQHSLTVPRVLTMGDGFIRQWPVEELLALRSNKTVLSFTEGVAETTVSCATWDMVATFDDSKKTERITINDELFFNYENGLFTLTFRGECAGNRQDRHIAMETLKDIRVLRDVSMLEIYINGGEYVMTTRYFPEETKKSTVYVRGAKDAVIWKMENMEVRYSVNIDEE